MTNKLWSFDIVPIFDGRVPAILLRGMNRYVILGYATARVSGKSPCSPASSMVRRVSVDEKFMNMLIGKFISYP
jgi:hypothetical protein